MFKSYSLLILLFTVFSQAETNFSYTIKTSVDFCSESNSFANNNAYWMSVISALSYEKPNKIKQLRKQFPDYSFKYLKSKVPGKLSNNFIGTDTQLLILKSENNLILSFRGTEIDSFENLQTDLSFKKERWGYYFGSVHAGFLAAFKSIWPKLLKELERMESGPNMNLWITGHSLGGALAQLASLQIMDLKTMGRLKNIKARALYTFGSPRVGDQEHAEKVNAFHKIFKVGVYRIRNHLDLVSMLPTSWNIPFGNYAHTNGLHYIDENLNLHKTKTDIPQEWIEINPIDFTQNISDHYIDSYIENLLEMANSCKN